MENSDRREYDEFDDAVSAGERPRAARRAENPYVIPGSIVIAGVLIAGAVFYANRGGTPTAPPGAAGRTTAAAGEGVRTPSAEALAGDAPFLGDPSALVAIVEFADFQCPFCGRFFHQTEPQIVEQYVKTGKARLVYRDFAFLGAESEWAAEAAECAGEQGKFWEYHDYLYSHQQGENEGAFTKTNLKKFSRAISGIDGKTFDSCLDSDKYLAAVRAETAAGQGFGVSGTPATFINGRLVSGAQPFAQFAAIIEEELKKASR